MKEMDFKYWSWVRRFVYLVIFIIGIILIFNTTASIPILNDGFDSIAGVSKATDKRTVYLLVSLFGFVGYFIETILERKYNDIKKEDIK